MYGLSHLGSGHLSGGHLGADPTVPSAVDASSLTPAPVNTVHPVLVIGGVALLVFILCRALDKRSTSTGD